MWNTTRTLSCNCLITEEKIYFCWHPNPPTSTSCSPVTQHYTKSWELGTAQPCHFPKSLVPSTSVGVTQQNSFGAAILIWQFQPQLTISQCKVYLSLQYWLIKDTKAKPLRVLVSHWGALCCYPLRMNRAQKTIDIHVQCVCCAMFYFTLQELMSFINHIPPSRRMCLYKLSDVKAASSQAKKHGEGKTEGEHTKICSKPFKIYSWVASQCGIISTFIQQTRELLPSLWILTPIGLKYWQSGAFE